MMQNLFKLFLIFILCSCSVVNVNRDHNIQASKEISYLYDNIVNNVIKYAKENNDIRLVYIGGSRGKNNQNLITQYSDIDFVVAVDNLNFYTKNTEWLKSIEDIKLTYLATAPNGSKVRRVIFKNFEEVDFVLTDIRTFKEVFLNRNSQISTRIFKDGIKILIDKDSIVTKNIINKMSSSYNPTVLKPTCSDLLDDVNNFYYHAIIIKKMLKKGDIFLAREYYEQYLNTKLLDMIKWHTYINKGWDYYILESRKFETWADTDIINMLPKVFAKYSSSEISTSLFEIMNLYKNIATEVTNNLECEFPKNNIDEIILYIKLLK